MKKYEHIVMLGKNCEAAFYFKKTFSFLDSNLLAWCAINEQYLPSILRNQSILLDNDYEPSGAGMLRHKKTGFNFHARINSGDNNCSLAIKDLLARIKHHSNKLQKIYSSPNNKLFICTIHDVSLIENGYVYDIHSTLSSLSNNFDLLCILPKGTSLPNNILPQNIHIRYLSHFAPTNKVTTVRLGDPKGWKKIYSEFGPVRIRYELKKYKFEFF